MSFEDFCNFNNIVVRIEKNIGTNVRGFCYFDGNNYIVFLNNRFDSNQIQTTMIHEIIHIMEDHFIMDRSCSIKAENEVDRIIRDMMYCFV
ncbi:ImmA/IrrE family metallo-endopeptidase [Erysipelothrix sp. D19-032]